MLNISSDDLVRNDSFRATQTDQNVRRFCLVLTFPNRSILVKENLPNASSLAAMVTVPTEGVSRASSPSPLVIRSWKVNISSFSGIVSFQTVKVTFTLLGLLPLGMIPAALKFTKSSPPNSLAFVIWNRKDDLFSMLSSYHVTCTGHTLIKRIFCKRQIFFLAVYRDDKQ